MLVQQLINSSILVDHLLFFYSQAFWANIALLVASTGMFPTGPLSELLSREEKKLQEPLTNTKTVGGRTKLIR